MRKLFLVLALAVLGCNSTATTSPQRKPIASAVRDVVPIVFPAPVLLTAVQAPGDSVTITWEPYVVPSNVILWGSVQGFADAGASTHVVGAFVYQDVLASGEITVPLDPNTQAASTVTVTLFVNVEDVDGFPAPQSVVSNSITFVDGASPVAAARPRHGHKKP